MSNKDMIRWTKEADETYLETISFILKKWTLKEVTLFETLTHELLDKLRYNLKLCPEINRLKVRKCVVSSQTSLVYRIKSNSIELIAFVDNRSEHDY